MSGFSAEWLALREPLDAAARDGALTAAFAAAIRPRDGATLEIVDLGAGTGANLRYLAPVIGGAQRWQLLDDDSNLLAGIAERLAQWAPTQGAVCTRAPSLLIDAARFRCSVEPVRLDLARDAARLRVPSGAVVTASALLDLVSEQWLDVIADRCRAAHASALFALTYDGRAGCTPEDPADALALRLFNEHQRRDKGFGPALGPAAAAAAANAFASRGYAVRSAPSDWLIGATHRRLQAELIDGWCRAAAEVAPERAAELTGWRSRRLAQSAAGTLAIRVGHVDLALTC